jgi:hypothetical protein
MILNFLINVLMWSKHYHDNDVTCHVARPNAEHVLEACISDGTVQVPSQFGGTYASRIVTIYYADGTMHQSVEPDLVEYVGNI